jgi:hypothetical protein
MFFFYNVFQVPNLHYNTPSFTLPGVRFVGGREEKLMPLDGLRGITMTMFLGTRNFGSGKVEKTVVTVHRL